MRAMQMPMVQGKVPQEFDTSPSGNAKLPNRSPGRGRERSAAIAAMYAGLALTLAATIVVYVDHATANVLARHIRAGYPTYSQARIDTAVTTYLICLSVVGALGIASWLWTIWAIKARKRWARLAASGMFAIGTGIALFALLVKDTSGGPGLAPLLGWVGLAPCLAGLLAITLLWSDRDARCA
jgi:hypothetical protein